MIFLRSKEYLYMICAEYFDINKIIDIKELTTGNINETYVVIFEKCKYILQLLNSHVYYSPIGVMNNTRLIVDHIRKKCIYNGQNPHRSVLSFIKTIHNQDLAIIDNEYWRCSEYIENAYSLETVSTSEEFYQIGRGIGNFQNLLSDFYTNLLDDTIKNFHNTAFRYEKFKETIELDKCDRVKMCSNEILFIKERSKKFSIITDKIKMGVIPSRVTHNDTKASNVMLDKKTKEYLCLIDLDTVMKGSLLFDYGDALRYGASKVSEDEENLELVDIDMNLFESFTKGFLEELKNSITKEEIKLLYEGIWMITIELGMRFLHDFLDGDRYFRITKPAHNLIRAKNQLQLIKKIEEKELIIKNKINDILRELEYDIDNMIVL